MEKTTFALFFGNRGFFLGELISQTRDQIVSALERAGYGYIVLNEGKTRFGAVETIEEGKLYAEFLRRNEGKYQGERIANAV